MKKHNLEYALYEGDKFIACGTMKEISFETGLKQNTIAFYGSKKHRDRLKNPDEGMMLIKIEVDDE